MGSEWTGRLVLALSCCFTAGGCDLGAGGKDKPKPAPSATSSTPGPAASSTGVTIELDPKSNRVKVKGAQALKGDPKDCAAFEACCSAPDTALFCGLLQAQPDKPSCAQARAKVKEFLKEKGVKAPAGC